MKKRFICAVFALLCALIAIVPHSPAAASGGCMLRDGFIQATFKSGFGDVPILLKTGFDFLDADSGAVNWDLALTGSVLSGLVYENDEARHLFLELGYDDSRMTLPDGKPENDLLNPVTCFAYKRLEGAGGKSRNLFAAVVRGTSNLPIDLETDFVDGAETMFDRTKGNIESIMEVYMELVTGRSIEELKQEDNYFFFTGHSLGGAVANALSVDETVVSLCGGSKDHIYTYTYESPHTCVALWWMHVDKMSNAVNFKDTDDAVTNVAPYIGATTYGTDMIFSVNELDNAIFKAIFPNAKGSSVTEAPHPWNYGDVFGHHDRGLCLVYILQHGIAAGWWRQVNKLGDTVSMWPRDTVATTAPPVTAAPALVDADFLIGSWSTSDGVVLSFYRDNTFSMQWGFFPAESGSWRAEPLSENTLRIELSGSMILSLMSMMYGSASSDYHFEILKQSEDAFSLVQVYGGYTAQTSPCKLPFSRTSGR